MSKTNRHKMIFVFGSNDSGIHGGGAAKDAVDNYGAIWGKAYGHHGDSFAIPTKDEFIKTLPLGRIQMYVGGFLAYALGHPKLLFQVTQLGCGLAGLKASDVAPMFVNAPDNCFFDEAWKPYLPNKQFWGAFP